MISIVVPTFNEEGNIEPLFKEIKNVLGKTEYEVIFVDDGSRDKSLAVLRALAKKDTHVKYLSFSRNFGHQAALRAGLRSSRGDAVISMDADLQHPPALLPEMIKLWRSGSQIVYTVRRDSSNTTAFKRITSKLFYKVLNFLSDLSLQEGAADFRLLDRKVVNLINDQDEADLFLRGYINWIGFEQSSIPYSPAERFSGVSKYSLKKMVSFAGLGVTQFSTKPLRLAFGLAFLAFGASILYVIYAMAAALTGAVVPGWLSLVTLFVFLQGFQFLLLGFIGEYLGRTFMQGKHRPEYIVAEQNGE